MSFVHLHVHTQYSLLESTIPVEDLILKTKEYGLSSVAMTDHGNMFGAVDFYLAAKAAEIKPIFGCEIFYTTGSRFQKGLASKLRKVTPSEEELEAARNYRLVLLCKDQQGYRNLCEIVTRGYADGFHYRPRVDYEILEKFSGGLIALSSGLKGELGFHSAAGRIEKAEKASEKLRSIYRENFYLEILETSLPSQSIANSFLVDHGKQKGIGVVAAADAHYLKREEGASQEVLMCIAAGRTLDENKGSRLSSDEFWYKDPQTMKTQFAWNEESLALSKTIADQCNFSFRLKDEKGRQIYHLPDYRPEAWSEESIPRPEFLNRQVELAKPLGEAFTAEKFLAILSKEGLKERLKHVTLPSDSTLTLEQYHQKYHDRLDEELTMITRTGFSGYFLVVSDFIGFAKSVQIPVGPGRGSGAGSLVAYCLKITDIDPIPFNLLFERFINPERISLPDFDVDFCQDRRSEVIDYVVHKYGKDNVAQIITFGKLLAKGVIRDVGRVLDLSYGEVDLIAKMVPEELGITLEDAFEKEPKLKELTKNDSRVAKLFEVARTLEGLSRHASVHAAGVVITNRKLVEYCPLFSGKEGESVVQFDKDFAEKIGLVKFDFLGLKTLTVIANALKFVHETQRKEGALEKDLLTLDSLPYTDSKVYSLISSGDTDGVFQLESSGMKDLCQKVIPNSLEDITAINALYRPGPLNSGMVDDFINRKHGRTEVVYELPQLAEILEETYGVIVYQEQVMRVARVLANYSLGEADILRRAMGKKKPEEMASQRDKFLAGCAANSIPKDKAEKIFDLLAKFAEYGFNKSHSAAYGVLSYQTAYLKAYYPAEFMAALMATEMDDTDKMAHYIGDARSHGIEILPPDINASEKTFSVVKFEGKPAIRFGLEAIKGVGGVAVDALLLERKEKGPFTDFIDFAKRVANRKVNKKVIECLISVGAFDLISNENRATLLESMEQVMTYAQKEQEQSDLGQVSMFDAYQAQGLKQMSMDTSHLYTRVGDWNESKKLQTEKSLVGFYVSGHPLEKWWPVAKDFVHGDLAWIKTDFDRRKELPLKERGVIAPKQAGLSGPAAYRNEGPRWDIVSVALVTSFREIMTKKGSRMAFVELEDAKTKIEAICFPESYEQNAVFLKQSIEECLPFIISGNVGLEEETAKIFIRSLDRIEEYQKKRVSSVVLKLDPSEVDTTKMAQLRGVLAKHRGKCQSFVEYTGEVKNAPSQLKYYSRYKLPSELHVQPSAEMAREVNGLFGRDVVKFF